MFRRINIVIRAIIKSDLDIDHWISSNDPRFHRLNDSLFYRRDVLARDNATFDRINEFKSFTARGEGFEFVDAIKGGVVPREYIPAVEKGVIEAMESGIVAGYPVIDVKVTLYDGSYHDVDSSEHAFRARNACSDESTS